MCDIQVNISDAAAIFFPKNIEILCKRYSFYPGAFDFLITEQFLILQQKWPFDHWQYIWKAALTKDGLIKTCGFHSNSGSGAYFVHPENCLLQY